MRSPRIAACAAAVCVLVVPLAARAALTPAGTLQTAQGTSAMTSADFDGDGHVDLLVTNAAEGTVSIFRGDGTGRFPARTDVPAGLRPFELAVGDLNGDGIADLAVGNEGDHTVDDMLGLGGGALEEARVVPIGPDLRALKFRRTSARSDLLVMRDQAVEVVTLESDGGFSTTSYQFGCGFGEVLVGDFDGDHDMDLLGIGSVSMAVMRGRADGGFDPHEDLFWQSGYEYLQFWWAAGGDMNGDGATDVVAGTYHHSQQFVDVGVWSGGAVPGARIHSPGLGLPVATGDLDGDGHLDMVAVKSHSQGCTVFRGDGQGGLVLEAEYPTGGRPFKAEIGDFDEDGRADLAILNYESASISLFGHHGMRPLSATPLPIRPGFARDDGQPSIEAIVPTPARVSGPTRVEFHLPRAADATLRVFDAAGRIVTDRALGTLTTGSHSVDWTAPAPGIYFVRLSTAGSHVGRSVAAIR